MVAVIAEIPAEQFDEGDWRRILAEVKAVPDDKKQLLSDQSSFSESDGNE